MGILKEMISSGAMQIRYDNPEEPPVESKVDRKYEPKTIRSYFVNDFVHAFTDGDENLQYDDVYIRYIHIEICNADISLTRYSSYKAMDPIDNPEHYFDIRYVVFCNEKYPLAELLDIYLRYNIANSTAERWEYLLGFKKWKKVLTDSIYKGVILHLTRVIDAGATAENLLLMFLIDCGGNTPREEVRRRRIESVMNTRDWYRTEASYLAALYLASK